MDTDFWNTDSMTSQENKSILFIGNDGKRDYEFVIELSKEMPDFNFKFITKKIDKSKLKTQMLNSYQVNGMTSILLTNK